MTAVIDQAMQGTSLESIEIDESYRDPTPLPPGHQGEYWMRRMVPVIRPQLPLIALGLVAAVVSMILRVEVPNVVRHAIDDSLGAHPQHSLGHYGLRLAVMGVAILLVGVTFRYSIQRAAFEMEYTLRVLMFRQFSKLSFSFYDRVQTGQLISRANSDVRSVQMFLAWGPMMGVSLISFVAALWFMLHIDVGLTFVSLLGLPFVFMASRRMHRWMFPVSWVVSARQADIATIVEENVGGAQVVRSFAAEKQQITALDRAAQRLQWASVRMADLRAKYGPLAQNLPRVGPALLLLYGGHLAIDGRITLGEFSAFSQYLLLMQVPFMMLGFLIMQAQRAAASAQRILEVLDEEPDLDDAPDATPLEDCRGDIELRDVTFSYVEDGEPVLHHLDLHLRPGETVALVGRTGSGKSTVARLVPRFYDVSDGEVLIDGQDVRGVTMHSLRANVGLVLDESFLFSGTVRENIAFGRPDASDAEVLAAAQAAGAEDFIDRLPDGYETIVGERGSTLSGGQRQRIAIARTLLVNPRILILDDCTSSIDAHREHEIHDALRTLMAGRTTLIIAHRLSTIALAERVVLLDGGRVLADGTHEELMRTVPEYFQILSQAEVHHHDPDGALPSDDSIDLPVAELADGTRGIL
ncbi:MAG: putative transporter ATP-binding protein [Actinomycetia bacterium]|nr:putative transporter ATP-binding protein [Actinomycetes bacterium]